MPIPNQPQKTHSYHKLFQKHECPKVNTIQRIRKLVITKMLIQELGLKWRIKKKKKKNLFQYQELRNKCNGKSGTWVQILLPKKKKKPNYLPRKIKPTQTK